MVVQVNENNLLSKVPKLYIQTSDDRRVQPIVMGRQAYYCYDQESTELVENFKERNCLPSITQPMVEVFVIYLTTPFKYPKKQLSMTNRQASYKYIANSWQIKSVQLSDTNV